MTPDCSKQLPALNIVTHSAVNGASLKQTLLIAITTFSALLCAACNGGSYGIVQPNPEDLCKCLPVEPDILDFRHIAKHVPIPVIAAQEIGVDTILSWTQDAFVAPDAPRTGENFRCSMWPLHFYRKPASTRRTAMCTSRFP